MNANELADDLNDVADVLREYTMEIKVMNECVTMLRQQQAEIEALKKKNKLLERDYNFMKDLAIGSESEIEALRMMIANRNDIIDKLDLK